MRKDYVIKKLNSKIEKMGSVALVCAFIVLAALFQDARGGKPRMFPADETTTVQSGSELRIECYGQGAKLQFSFPENTVLVPRSDHEILQTRNGTYTFLRGFVVPGDAGWYACAEEGIEIDNHFTNINHTHEDIGWLYVYVDDDADKYFVDSGMDRLPKTIAVVAGGTVVVPCRFHRLGVFPELWQNFRLLSTDRTAVQYDPTIGFIIKEVDFEGGEAIFDCVISFFRERYVFRLSTNAGTKPTMITSGDELILQEGDELKIECYAKRKLSFFFPEKFSNSSKYEIFANESGVNTFLRRSAVADDTGWYGCGGEGIKNDIPYHSINYTRKGISWIYVYVNSTVPVTSGAVFGSGQWTIIPCRPTSPRLHIQLSCRNCSDPDSLRDVRFDPKLGFAIHSTFDSQAVISCTTNEPVDYVSKTYNKLSIYEESKNYWPPTIVDADDVSAPEDLLIRMTGEDLHLSCDAAFLEVMPFRLEWIVPIKVSEGRVRYNLTQADGHFENSMYWRGKKMTMTINNMRETDSGEYVCHSRLLSDILPVSDSRRVEVFDVHGGRYIKLGGKYNYLKVTGAEGTTLKWLVDLGDFPSAQIAWYRYDQFKDWFKITSDPEGSRHIKATSKGGSPYMLFTINNLEFADEGSYRLSADIGNVTAFNYFISLKVRVPPRAIIQKFKRYSYKRGENVAAICKVSGNPSLEVRWNFWNYPKFPSRKDSKRVKLDTPNEGNLPHNPAGVPIDVNFDITMSGILTCEACTSTNCSLDQSQILCSTTDEPYFTSTNLNQSEVTWSLGRDEDKIFVLECYAAGEPYPNVTWFKDNIPLQESTQFKFAYDNRELSILYFVDGDSGRYMCRAENEHGKVENYVNIKIEGALDVLRLSLFAAAAVLFGIIVVSWVVIWKQRTEAARKESINLAFKNGAMDSLNPDMPIVDQAELLPYDLKWEFPRELLTLDKILGSGAFGIVKKATAKSICRGEAVTTVAVKLVRSKASLNYITALTRELKILVHLGKHINVVNLLGACTKHVSYGELLVIVEYCHFGNLHDYLLRGRADFIDQTRSKTEQTSVTDVDADQIVITDEIPDPNYGELTMDRDQHTGSATNSLRDDDRISGEDPCNAQDLRSKYKGDYEDTNLEPISTRDLVYWSWQVSRGMDYLGKRRVVHGDLAARNILLADNGIVKISDFGLSKALYEEAQYRDQGVDPLPVKWMAIESIKDRLFSYQSDIWSFGIVMWEFFTLAKTPYPGIRPSELYHELINGHRMEQPEYAVTTIYDTMLDCWEADPSRRPSFAKLTESIGDLLDEGFKTRYLEINSLYLEIDARIFNDDKKDYLTLSPTTFEAAPSFTSGEQMQMETSLPSGESETSV